MGNAFQAPKTSSSYEKFWLDSVSNAVLVEILGQSMPKQGPPQKSVMPNLLLVLLAIWATWP